MQCWLAFHYTLYGACNRSWTRPHGSSSRHRSAIISLLHAFIKLHWLPAKQRVLYKQALMTFNVLRRNNPSYLRDLLTIHNRSRYILRSSSHHLLSVGYMRTVSSSRCYKHSAATNWNDLPYDLRDCSSVSVFKRRLKSYLFSICLLPSYVTHVSPQRLRSTLLHMARYKA